jgi:hypothetical protein
MLFTVLTGFGCMLLVAEIDQKPQPDIDKHPVSMITKMLKEQKVKTIYIFPYYILRNQENPSEVLIGRNVTSVKIEDSDQIKKFSELFVEDVSYSFSIPERIPRGSDRNIILFISSGNHQVDEWYLFKLRSGWWFMKNWKKSESQEKEFTNFMKCGDKMAAYLDGLIK